MSTPRVMTQYLPQALDRDLSLGTFEYLRLNVPWQEGIRSRSGFTRLAYPIDPDGDSDVEVTVRSLIDAVMSERRRRSRMPRESTSEVDHEVAVMSRLGHVATVHGVYLNYLVNGDHYVPAHTHAGSVQLVISLGAHRTLTVGRTDYRLQSGDAIVFGSSSHGVRKEPGAGGRISIACFML